MTELVITIKSDYPFNFVYFSVFEYLCILLEFLFTGSMVFSLHNSSHPTIHYSVFVRLRINTRIEYA